MRVASRGINEFVPAVWTIPQNPFTGMAGLGDLIPGRFAVPQTPVGMGDLAPTAALYQFPDNSVLSAAKINGLAGLGCPCGMSGITDTLTGWETTAESRVASMLGVSATTAKYITYGGVAVVALLALSMLKKR